MNYIMIIHLLQRNSSDMLSIYCKNIANEYDIKVGDIKKLIPN